MNTRIKDSDYYCRLYNRCCFFQHIGLVSVATMRRAWAKFEVAVYNEMP